MYAYTEPVIDREPDLAAIRAVLVDQIRRKPEPEPAPRVESSARAGDRWLRASRLASARRVLRVLENDARIALALGVAPSTVGRWRGGRHAPTVRHWRRLWALGHLLAAAGPHRLHPGVQILDRAAGNGHAATL
jgi:hypothetical protein